MNSLSHAFPEKDERWRREVFQTACARLAEMGLFRLASAYFGDARLEKTLELSPQAEAIIGKYELGGTRHGHPVVIMLPHMTMSEAATMLPARGEGLKPVHVIFRPLNQASINRWVTAERERCGAKMISRRSGHNDAMAALRRGEMVAVLFDQDAASRGAMITFMGRIVSATELPALMAHRYGADVYLMMPERQSFWQAKLTLTPIPLGESPVDVTIAAHDALERYLRRNQDTAADWLWLHNRWNYAYKPHKRFHLPEKRNHLARANELHGDEVLPRNTRFWVWVPDRLDDMVLSLPVLRAIRAGRPDVAFTLVGRLAFEPVVNRAGVADRFVALPDRGLGYFEKFYAMRRSYPDTCLLLAESFRGDLEALCTRCQQRFGLVRPGGRRPLLTKPFRLPREMDETPTHQTAILERMAQGYGLKMPLSYDSVPPADVIRVPNRVGLVCGGRHASGYGGSVEFWRSLVTQLIEQRPTVEIVVGSTAADRDLVDQVCAGFPGAQVRLIAKATDLGRMCDALGACAVVAGDDPGGVHLANLSGVPVVALFVEGDSLKRRPVFNAPVSLLDPEEAPAEGMDTKHMLEKILGFLA